MPAFGLDAFGLHVTAEGLVGLLGGLPAVRQLSAKPPLVKEVELAGIEVAAVGGALDPAHVAQLWRATQRGAAPLLLIADGTGSDFIVVGPLDSASARTVKPGALERLLRALSSQSRLRAVRELTLRLDQLDRSGIPGLRLRDLLTVHTLIDRLRGDVSRWEAATAIARPVPRSAGWRSAVESLGYEVERRPQRGYLLRSRHRPVAVVHPKADVAAFSRLDEGGRPPEGTLIRDCHQEGVRFGILAAESRLRLFFFDPETSGATTRWLELDAVSLSNEHWPLLALVSPAYLADGEFDALVRDASRFGAALRGRLDERVRQQALPALAHGLGRWAQDHGLDLGDPSVLEELERASLTLLFRLLFVLFAESALYLPMENASYEQSSLTLLAEDAERRQAEYAGSSSTWLWDGAQKIVRAVRNGAPPLAVPAYNGALFAADGFDGATTLERLTLPDADFSQVLIAVGRDPDGATGVDYSTLGIGHLGHLYEALLSLRLSQAKSALVYDAKQDRYRAPRGGEHATIEPGDLLWQTDTGGRKSGGVYYTPPPLVRHLVSESVGPAFDRHLKVVAEIATDDPDAAARALLTFSVVDPACGSAHFLVEVLDLLADRTVSFLAVQPLPRISEAIGRLRAAAPTGTTVEDTAVIRRLLLKHCVYGVDISPMGAEVAKVSLWLASFVPGLSLTYLDGNVKVGNSLLGVARTESVGADNGRKPPDWSASLKAAADAAARAAEIEDRTPEEVQESQVAARAGVEGSRAALRLMNLWTAGLLGLPAAREEAQAFAAELLRGARKSGFQSKADQLAADNGVLHWPIAFPLAFTGSKPGFDAVVGNPPWDEVTVEELGFYGQFSPGLRGMDQASRQQALSALRADRPELAERLAARQEAVATQRRYLAASDGGKSSGDPDLYKYFCRRYRDLLSSGGQLGVVLPRTAFAAEGSTGFREWLFTQTSCDRIDFLLNSGRWAFDAEPRYTVALVSSRNVEPTPGHTIAIAGVADSASAWERQSTSPGVPMTTAAFTSRHAVPLVGSAAQADLLTRLHEGGEPFPLAGRWRCFAVRELDETNDKHLWEHADTGVPLWKGESFDQYEPTGVGARLIPMSAAVRKKIEKPRPGSGSIVADECSVVERRKAVMRALGRARIAFRDVTRATDSRTARACLIPPGVLLTNTAPYLAFVRGDQRAQAACLAVMNSLVFDWQTRRFAEIHLNFFILEGLSVPRLLDADFVAIADAAARLSSVDERFIDFAEAFDHTPAELDDHERDRLRAGIDARVAKAWSLSADDLDVVFDDFTLDAVPASYRDTVLALFESL